MVDVNLEKKYFDHSWSEINKKIRISESLTIPGVSSLKEKRVLVCSCGSGIGPVQAANAGADVYAVDISHVAVQNAREIAEFNGVKVKLSVQDLHHLNFPDGFFDVVYGSAVLHHLDIDRACREFIRILKTTGVAVFKSEPTFKNPLIKLAYELAFGKTSEGRRRSFLFVRRRGTDNEKPLDKLEFIILQKYFPGYELIPCDFMFFQKLSHVTKGKFEKITTSMDKKLLKLFPKIKKWSYEFDIIMIKH